ncbi:aminotransferase class V-fold PLP-dependent enzyme [Cytobacillus spongiae]|jgi:selenocysteine lyase/cysteine desulfurase|uniref:aminotransferase class V-fold PLP-dependent enzyme n=1 Tax=Cytobacillus spongiae TaxID=2901381 RepID=UPI001F3051AD|nr:aminotransferase class V-fold PLP-dependent enzyme [Cytobacillus spongiae]UII57547.1 aminotransferase class V-fold PLP-dependent enzyme [Cytobacillus spongiae]
MLNVADLRSKFPILQNKIVLSSCSQSAISLDVLNAMEEYKESLLLHGMAWDLWMEKVENSKKEFAKLIHCDPKEVAVLSSVSDSISSILHALDLKGKEVCLTEMDFPCIGHAILAQQIKKEFNVTYIPHHNYTINSDIYEQFVHKNTALTCIPHVSYYNGFKQDLKKIAEIVHENGSLLFVDAYQSAGSIDINVKEMGIDFLAAGMQKYLLGVPGISFLYINHELAETLEPATTGWFGQAKPFDFNLFDLEYAESAQRFNTGTPPVMNAYVANAALLMINSIGMPAIEAYLNELSSFAIEQAKELELPIMSPSSPAMKGPNTAFYVENAHIIEEKMKQEGFIVSARQDVIRMAPHLYNTKDDLKEAIHLFKKLR